MHVYIHNIFGVDDTTFVVCNKQGAVVCPVQQQPRTWWNCLIGPWISHGTRMNESWHTNEWVMPRVSIQLDQGPTTAPNSSELSARKQTKCRIHLWMSHVPHKYETCLMYEWVMAHMWMPTWVRDVDHATHTWISLVILLSRRGRT